MHAHSMETGNSGWKSSFPTTAALVARLDDSSCEEPEGFALEFRGVGDAAAAGESPKPTHHVVAVLSALGALLLVLADANADRPAAQRRLKFTAGAACHTVEWCNRTPRELAVTVPRQLGAVQADAERGSRAMAPNPRRPSPCGVPWHAPSAALDCIRPGCLASAARAVDAKCLSYNAKK